MSKMDHGERLEMLGEFVEIVEDFLEARGIDIPNDEKEGDDDASMIYGSDYFELTDAFERKMIECGLIDKEGEEP